MRVEEYIIGFEEEIEQRLVMDRECLENAYEASKESYDTRLTEGMNKLLTQCSNYQRQGKIKEIQYIVVHRLRTSVRMKTYEYRISLYDEALYLNRNSVCYDWASPYFPALAEKSTLYFTKLIRDHYIRVADSEIALFMEKYFFSLMQEIPCEILSVFDAWNRGEGIPYVAKSDTVGFYQGEYLGSLDALKMG